MKITRAGVDIEKSVFHVHGVDGHDKPVWQVKEADRKMNNPAASYGVSQNSAS